MSPEVILLSILGTVQLTINISTMFLTLPAKRSVRFSIVLLLVFTLILFGTLFLTGLINNDLANLVGLVYLPIMLWLFKGHIFQKTFAFFLQYLLTTLQISVAVATVSLFSGNENSSATVVGLMANSASKTEILFIFALISVLFAVYTFLVIKYGRVVFQKLFIHGHPSEWLLYSFGAVFSFAVMIVIRNSSISAWQHIVVLLFILWSFVMLCFAVINAHEKSKQRYEAEFARDVISTGREHYQKMNEMYDTLRVMRHDYKYHLDTIGELLYSGNKTEAEKYLTDTQKQLSERQLANYCSNTVLNALLANYSERCAKMKVKYDVNVSIPKVISIPNYEMCIILGNLLENAVEASSRHNGRRRIELVINTQGTHLAIMVKNNFNGDIAQDNGLPLSTKKDGGLGLRSVQAVAARHGGELMTEWDGTVFAAYVLMRL